MLGIGFENYKKFKLLSPVLFSPITFLVGENNSGKSTIIKGLLSAIKLLKNGFCSRKKNSETDKTTNNDENNSVFPLIINIEDSYESLKNKKTESDTTKFALYIDSCLYIFVLSNEIDNNHSTILSNIQLYDESYNLEFHIDFSTNIAAIILKKIDIQSIQKEINEINNNKDLLTSEIPIEYNISTSEEKDGILILFELSNILRYIKSEHSEHKDWSFQSMSSIFYDFTDILEDINDKINFKYAHIKKIFKNLTKYFENKIDLNIPEDVPQLEHIAAHQIVLNNVISDRDYSNYVNSTVNELLTKDVPQEIRDGFINHWLKEFNIGEEYQVKNIEGEANIIYIKDVKGNKQNLVDKGIGSIRLVVLIFRIAIILIDNMQGPFYDEDDKIKVNNVLVIVEEPEQNLHPKYQSKLTDLFYDIYK